jgi:internalin A
MHSPRRESEPSGRIGELKASAFTSLKQQRGGVGHQRACYWVGFGTVEQAMIFPIGSTEGLAEARRRIAEAGRAGAEELDLGGLGLTAAPEELFELGQLKALYLGHSKVAAGKPRRERTLQDHNARNAIEALPPALFTSLPRLTTLDLEHNRLTGLPDTIWRLNELAVLDLENNKIGDEGAQALSGLVSLRALDLGDNRIGDEGARALSGLVNLASLDLGSNGIGAEGAQALSGLVNLADLNLYGNKIDAEGAQALSGLVNLSFLHLGVNRIGAEGAQALSGLVNLSFLHLGVNRIGDKGAQALSGLINLAILYLGGNGIGDEGVRALSGLINLTRLEVRDNEMGFEGARCLSGLVNLTFLDAAWNNVGAEGARALSGLINLTSFKLGGNKIGDEGARALPSLANLTHLDLADTSVKDLSPLLKLNKLERLNCAGCHLDDPTLALWTAPSLKWVSLYNASLPGVPAEALSKSSYNNCLESLRAHFADLEGGDDALADVKLLILGNGRVGKTQICRRLRGEGYDPSVPSTHGVQVRSAPLPLAPDDAASLKLWDFGGQEIYHGTHALFLKTHAAFLLAWTPETESAPFHRHDGFAFRNQPLGYWLAYVRQFAGPDAPVIVVQTQCDAPEDERLPPVADDALAVFPFIKTLAYSARKNRGRAELDEALAEAVCWLRKRQGAVRIGEGRARVKVRLEEMREAGERLISQAEFQALCGEAGQVSSPSALLDYLHHSGVVFHRRGLFGDAVILDQAWALEAVYAVFDRETGTLKTIERNRGCFRRSDLAEGVWRSHSAAEQELFLSFMRQCGVCFTFRRRNGDSEAEYIAPDLLPQRDDPEIAVQLHNKWDGRRHAEARLCYDLLPPDLMRSLIARIGELMGPAGEYWRDGFYCHDERTGAKALVEQRRTGGWAGEIDVQTQDGKAETLRDYIVKLIDCRQDATGARARALSLTGRGAGLP